MTAASTCKLIALVPLALLVACGTDSELPSELGPGITAHAFFPDRSSWSVPVNLGAPVNSAGDEFAATLSPDELSLYVNSNRTDLPGAQGGNDIWVSRRGCPDWDDPACAWQTPVNLGPLINSPANEGTPSFSNDGHVMFFNSARTGIGFGRSDIYLSRRTDPKDDFDWGPPVNLGPDVNTSDVEGATGYLQSAQNAPAELHFNRGVIQQQKADIYVVRVTRSGETLGPAVLVSELSDPTVNDGGLTVRWDGRELIFWSNRNSPNGHLFVSTRRSVHDAWSTPTNLGAPVNTEFGEIGARLSKDGRTLLITSARPGGLGGTNFGFDIWMSTRTPSGH